MLKMSCCQDWLADKIKAANNGIKSDGKTRRALCRTLCDKENNFKGEIKWRTYRVLNLTLSIAPCVNRR